VLVKVPKVIRAAAKAKRLLRIMVCLRFPAPASLPWHDRIRTVADPYPDDGLERF
jgi:hypothetical protein